MHHFTFNIQRQFEWPARDRIINKWFNFHSFWHFRLIPLTIENDFVRIKSVIRAMLFTCLVFVVNHWQTGLLPFSPVFANFNFILQSLGHDWKHCKGNNCSVSFYRKLFWIDSLVVTCWIERKIFSAIWPHCKHCHLNFQSIENEISKIWLTTFIRKD